MKVHIKDDFDLEKIADSGQCFRWFKEDENEYRVIAGKSCVYIRKDADGVYCFDCCEEEYNSFWVNYLDLKEEYSAIRQRVIKEDDPFLWDASTHEKGIRILRQDPWEMLITFIISQNRNIPAIKNSVELLAKTCGEKETDSKGINYFAFPKPEALFALSEKELQDCKLGYRCRYIHAAAQAVKDRDIILSQLLDADEETTIKTLTDLLGVGIKVANCISLFGLHHIDAFPIDVWMKRILKEYYPNGYPFEKYSPYNGIYQQYMFAYYRTLQQKA